MKHGGSRRTVLLILVITSLYIISLFYPSVLLSPFKAFKTPSGSMAPTLIVGDHLLVNKFAYGISIPFSNRKFLSAKPKRGDIIVFKYPADPSKNYIKRVIGLPGDRVEMRGIDVLLNGVPLPRTIKGPYPHKGSAGSEYAGDLYVETIDGASHEVLYDRTDIRPGDTVQAVPAGQYFCLGDNRDHSNDSRYWGFVPEENIIGKASIIYFSWPRSQWNRIGTKVQ